MNNIPRRRFLRQTARWTATAPLWGAILASSTQRLVAASDRVRLGVIGCGGMGRGDLATFFLNDDIGDPKLFTRRGAEPAGSARRPDGE